MRFLSKGIFLLFLSGSMVLLTAAFPSSKIDPKKVEAAVKATNHAAADGHLSYKELKSIATDLKGDKLTLKERVSLKLFKKKVANKSTSAAAEGKSQVIALILCALIGGLGIHRFYLGYTWQGIVQLLTAGGCGVWWLIDLVRIITGDLKPKGGEYTKTL